MSCIVITTRGKQGSFYYRTKTEEEVKKLFSTLSLLRKEGLQIVTVSDIKDYGEYELATEIKTLAQLFIIAGSEALED